MSIFQNVEKKLQHRNERQVFTFKHLKAAKQFLDYERQKGFYTVWLVKTAEIFTIIELHLKYLILESLNYLIKIQINYEPKFYSILFDLGQNILGFFQHLSFQLFLATSKNTSFKMSADLKKHDSRPNQWFTAWNFTKERNSGKINKKRGLRRMSQVPI